MKALTPAIQDALRVLTSALAPGQSVTIYGMGGDLVYFTDTGSLGYAKQETLRTQDAAPKIGPPRNYVFCNREGHPFYVKETGGVLVCHSFWKGDNGKCEWRPLREMTEAEWTETRDAAISPERADTYHFRVSNSD